ncbi:MAG: hypothetical protein K4571_13635 [Deltaproteobacteria bacterium]
MKDNKLHLHFSSFLPEIGLFAISVALAAYFEWTAKDLLWSLWISSLTVGYCTILAGIGRNLFQGNIADDAGTGKDGAALNPSKKVSQNAGAVMAAFFLLPMAGFFGFSIITLIYALFAGLSIGVAVIRHWSGDHENAAIRFLMNFIVNLPATAFMLGFFTIHFGGFHFVHSMFLNGFFPLVPGEPFGQSLDSTFGMFFTLISVSIVSYWPFIVTSAAASISDITHAAGGKKGDLFFDPYKNVIKMHLMIFIIAFMGAGGLNQYILYATLVIYFFPFSRVFTFRKKIQDEAESS